MLEVTQNLTIQLQIRKPYFENYLRYLFACQEGPIIVIRDKPTGRYLFSRVNSCQTVPVMDPEKKYITLVMPVHGLDCSKYRFSTFDAEDTARINDYIESSAYLEFMTMISVGTRDLKMERKTVISIFSHMIYGEEGFEMWKKREYRHRQRISNWLKDTAKELAY